MKKSLRIAGMLGWQDLRQAYRRSALGPFWITAGMVVQIATMGIVFSLIFKTDYKEYFPFLAVSIVLWNLMSTTLIESCHSIISADAMIRQLDLSPLIYVFRSLWKNILTFLHHVAIIPVVLLVSQRPVGFEILLEIPGMLIVLLNLGWMATLLSALSARYRDLPPIIVSLMTILFYVTPVMWYPTLLPGGTAHVLLGLNPFYHLVQIVRLPILGQLPTLENWTLASLSAVAGVGITSLIFRRLRPKIAYWV